MKFNETLKTATVRNLYNGDEFTTAFPHSEFELDNIQDRATTYGLHDYAIVDLEGFYGLVDSRWCGVYGLNDIAERLERLEDEDADKLEAMAEVMDNLDDIERAWNESYFIADTTLVDYAELEAEERGDIPASLPEYIKFNIDWDSIAADMELSREYYEVNGGVLRVAQ